jgi:transcriptional regulator with XRE-family HTH domain
VTGIADVYHVMSMFYRDLWTGSLCECKVGFITFDVILCTLRLIMTGQTLRQARTNLRMSQVDAAARLGVSQTLLSLMEKGERSVTPPVAEKAVALLRATPEQLPVSAGTRHSDDQLAADLGALGYPGYGYLQGQPRNPTELLFDALDRPNLDARVVEALPWLPLQYPNMDWDWLTTQARVRNRQNRLGFVVALSAKVAKKQAKRGVAERLSQVVKALEESRLANTDTLCQESWPPSQRKFAHQQRSALAAHWKMDTRLTEENLAWFTA